MRDTARRRRGARPDTTPPHEVTASIFGVLGSRHGAGALDNDSPTIDRARRARPQPDFGGRGAPPPRTHPNHHAAALFQTAGGTLLLPQIEATA